MSAIVARTVSAPGKLVVAGEYAVLEGHPALVAGVSKRAHATFDNDDAPFRISGMSLGPFVVERSESGVVLAGDTRDALVLPRSVLDVLVRRGVVLPETGHLSLHSRAFLARARSVKLGLGSSAAVAVALTGALVDDVRDRERVFALALEGHLAFSGGRGSGIDVAASTMGGLTRFERTPNGPVIAAAPHIPHALAVVVVFAGHAQNTRTFVDAVKRLSSSDDPLYRARLLAIREGTDALLSSCERRDADAFLRAIDACRVAMAALGESAHIDIVSAPHRAIADVAASCGGAAKPSGAGGGDVALVFVPHEARAACEERLSERGFLVVDVRLFSAGVREDRPRA
jgi:phosphomevalonate kinase